MQLIVPDYYNEFHCIADKCRHNCCIGWEIDIDEDTLGLYDGIGGNFGERLRKNISNDECPHFILTNDERCPFLNEHGLCDIITELGDGALSDICADHPRFRNYFRDRLEMGLGLCCEEAARIILSKKEPARFLELETEAEFDRPLPRLPSGNFKEQDFWELLFSLERLDPLWDEYLELLKLPKAEIPPALTEPVARLSEYLLFRHSKLDGGDLFAAFSVYILSRIAAAYRQKHGSCPLDRFIDICRMYSAEIEYSDENIEIILENIKGSSF